MARVFPTEFGSADRNAVLAANRFGLGARPGDIPFIAEDPFGWAMRQLEQLADPPDELVGLPASPEVVTALLRSRGDDPAAFQREARIQYQRETDRHMLLAVNAEEPFRERLVQFWCNHFSVSIRHPQVLPLAHAFEREVVRPNLGARFYDMLMAAARHPALLFYLGQVGSVGPNSPVGRSGRGRVNEAYARALIELYTMGTGETAGLGGPRGYDGSDIKNLALLLTGWSVGGPGAESPGGFLFREEWHEHGRKRFLGRIFPEAGVLSGEAAIEALSRRIETGRNLALKMARHFVADEPPAGLVGSMVSAFANSGGSLHAMTEEMIRHSTAWELPQRKVKSPQDFVLSAFRALGARPEKTAALVSGMAQLGQAPKDAPTPAGWPESGTFWLRDGRLSGRLELSEAYGRFGAMQLRESGAGMDGIDIAFETLGPLLREATYRRLAVAADTGEQLSLLFAAPEFQRR